MILKDKTVIITGGTRGLGKELCLEFAKNGCNVIFTYSRSQTESKKVKLEIEKLGVTAKFFKLNLLSPDNINQFCEIIKKENINFDFLINNAASGVMKNSIETTEKHWDWTMQVNVKGPWLLSKNLSKNINKKGKIINISSVVGIRGNIGQSNYSASKAGIHSFTKSVAKEVATRNITVNVIAPGYVSTATTNVLSEKVKKEVMSWIPMQRFGEPEEIAPIAAFLSREEARYITGEIIRVDGGMAI